MKQYTNYCTEKQTKRAYKLGAPIHIFECENKISKEAFIETGRIVELEDNKLGDIPTTQQMLGWLETKGMYIEIIIAFTDDDAKNRWTRSFTLFDESSQIGEGIIYMSVYEAELEAIDEALDSLEKGE